MTLAYPWVLWLWLMLPMLYLLDWLSVCQQSKKRAQFMNERYVLVDQSRRKVIFRRLLRYVAYALLIFVLARPQLGTGVEVMKTKGIDLVFAVDTSTSMATEDLQFGDNQGISRMQAAKRFINALVQKIADHRIALVGFAGKANTVIPLTLDHAALDLFQKELNIGMIEEPGTDLGAAVKECLRALPLQEKSGKAIILITDGEGNMGDWHDAVRAAAQSGVTVYTLGAGTEQGNPIPLRNANGDIENYKKDKNGEIVLSKLDEQTLWQMAEMTGGKYYRLTQRGTEVEYLQRDLDRLKKKDLSSSVIRMYEERYWWFLLVVVFILVLEGLVSEIRGRGHYSNTDP